MLWYLPLEPYKARYTELLRGWMENNWFKAHVSFRTIAPSSKLMENLSEDVITTGVVLDAFRRSRWCLLQMLDLLDYINVGAITSEDTIYFEDFFHPGLEAVAYCCHLKGIKPKLWAYWWAQSVDKFDFTYAMRDWMRHYELMGLNILDGIFVACPSMKKMIGDVFDSGESSFDQDKVHIVGLPFDSEDVLNRTPLWYQHQQKTNRPPLHEVRKNQVVFSSRWDKEKNPDFFCEVARRVQQQIPDAQFAICTGSERIRSNTKFLQTIAADIRDGLYPGIRLCEGLSKEQYYQILCESKVQFNCADQDWVSFTLLEASVCGCYPVYPAFRSFPETLKGVPGQYYLYQHNNIDAAVMGVMNVLRRDDLWTPEQIKKRSWIHERFDPTWLRMLKIMGCEGPNKKMAGGIPYLSPFDNTKWVRA